MTAILLAYVAGLVTILNPCVLPVLPLVVASALNQNRFGPLALMGGLVVSFSTIGLGITAFGFQAGLQQDTLKYVIAVILLVAGVMLLVPRAQAAFATAMGPVVNRGNQLLGKVSGDGLGGQALVGLLLGIVWVPCVGPTLGVAIAAASQGEGLFVAFLTFLVFSLGVATSMLAFAYGSRKALGARQQGFKAVARYAKPIFGGSLVLVALLMLSGADKVIEIWLLDHMPGWWLDFTTRY